MESWTPTRVREIGRTYGGLSGKNKDDFGKGDALYVTFLGVLENTAVGMEEASQVNIGVHETQNRVLKGDLLFNGTSETPGELAMGAVVRDDIPNLFLNSFCFGLRLRDPAIHNASFLAYLSRGGPGRAATRALSQGATRYNISKAQFRQLTFHLPPPREQRDIAEVLSDVDLLLESLNALIAKKRAVQTATMQQLLRGRIRLPGFSHEWGKTEIGEIARIVSGGTPDTQNASYWNGGVPWCVPTDITNNSGKYLQGTARTITELGLSNSGASLLPAGALLLCSRATVGEVSIALTPICTNQGFKSLVCHDGTLNEFVYYLILTLRRRLIERSSGSTFLEISKNAIGSIEVRLPALEEQREIASVLSDMDLEIKALEERRDKVRALKEGMMQQLLTGRTRLVEPPAGGGEAAPS